MAFLLPGERQMADKIVTVQQLIDANGNCQSWEKYWDGKADEDVQTIRGKHYPTHAKAQKLMLDNGGYRGFKDKEAILAYMPEIPNIVVKDLETFKLWQWDGTQWHDTGLSELDQAKLFVPTVAVTNKGVATGLSVNNVRDIGTWYISNALDLPLDFPSTIKNVIVKNEKFGAHTLQFVWDRFNLTNFWFRINFLDWSKQITNNDILNSENNVKNFIPTVAVTSRGTIDALAVTSNHTLGAYYGTNATELPLDFTSSQKAVLLRNEKFGAHTVKFLQDRYRPEHIWYQLNNTGFVKLLTKPTRNSFLSYTQFDDKYKEFNVVKLTKQLSDVDQDIQDMSTKDVLAAMDNPLETLIYLYDDLVLNFPEYVSKKSLGKDVTGLDVYEYVFSPVFVGKNVSSPPEYNKFPKCLILCGHHGFEMSSALAVALFMRQMCNNFTSEEIYLKAKTHLEFRVIPTANPWGTQHNQRRNSNNVDLNRNFPTEWDKADAGARGPSPLSELENQYILAWIEENADAEVLINVHDHGDPALAWGATEGFKWTHYMLFNAFKDLGFWYFNNFEKPESQKDQVLSWLGITVSGGLDKHCAQVLNFPTILYESPYINHPLLPKGQTAPRLASEEVLKSLIRQLIDRYYLKSIA